MENETDTEKYDREVREAREYNEQVEELRNKIIAGLGKKLSGSSEGDEGPQKKEEALDFFVSLSPEELKGVEGFVKANKDSALGLPELKQALIDFRLQRAKRAYKDRPLEERLAEAGIAEKAKILEEAGLYQDIKQHYFQGKELPENYFTNLDRSRELWEELKPAEQKYAGKKPEKSRADTPIYPEADINSFKGMPKNWSLSRTALPEEDLRP